MRCKTIAARSCSGVAATLDLTHLPSAHPRMIGGRVFGVILVGIRFHSFAAQVHLLVIPGAGQRLAVHRGQIGHEVVNRRKTVIERSDGLISSPRNLVRPTSFMIFPGETPLHPIGYPQFRLPAALFSARAADPRYSARLDRVDRKSRYCAGTSWRALLSGHR